MQLVAQSRLQAVGPAVHGGGSDALRLIVLRRNDAALERIGDNNPRGAIIDAPAIGPAHPDLPVTAVHGRGSNWLRLMSRRASAAAGAGTITRLGDSGTEIGEPNGSGDLARVGGPLVAVAIRTVGSDRLRILLLGVTSDREFSRRAHSRHLAGRITAPPSICLVGPSGAPGGPPTTGLPGPRLDATAIRTSTGRLEVITFRVEGDGVARASDGGNAGPHITGRPAIVASPKEGIVVATAREADSGQLVLQCWQVGGTGTLAQRSTRFGATMIATPGLALAPNIPASLDEAQGVVATAVARGRVAGLKVDRWHLQRDVTARKDIRRSGAFAGLVAGSPGMVGAMTGTVAHDGVPRATSPWRIASPTPAGCVCCARGPADPRRAMLRRCPPPSDPPTGRGRASSPVRADRLAGRRPRRQAAPSATASPPAWRQADRPRAHGRSRRCRVVATAACASAA